MGSFLGEVETVIKVKLAPTPANFNKSVRDPGLDAIRELVGEIPLVKRRGRKRKKIAESRDLIPSESFPAFWQDAIPDMLRAYNETCAYLAIHIWAGVGTPTVDHMTAKSTSWDKIYEWENYRLSSGLMNARKNKYDDVIDPFKVVDGLFSLEFVAFQVSAGPKVDKNSAAIVQSTIARLQLNSVECCRARSTYVIEYRNGNINFDFLKRKAPFIALEMYNKGEIAIPDMPEAKIFATNRVGT